jgi:transposase
MAGKAIEDYLCTIVKSLYIVILFFYLCAGHIHCIFANRYLISNRYQAKFIIFAEKSMKYLKVFPHYSDTELKEILYSQKELRSFRDWQIIYSVQRNPGKLAAEIADILGVKRSKVLYVIQRYNKFGAHWRVYGKWGGRREERSLIPLEEERKILKELESDALLGKIVTFRQIKSVIENKIAKTVSDDYIWDLFSRHNWTKQVPRPIHPKSDKQAHQEYKKTSGVTWQPSQ